MYGGKEESLVGTRSDLIMSLTRVFRHPVRHWVLLCLVIIPAFGVWSAAEPGLAGSSCRVERLAWSEPTIVGRGFEPGVSVDKNGTIFVTGAADNSSGNQQSSGLWRSTNSGKTFEAMRQVNADRFGVEGDIALDGRGRLYFVDTFLIDSYLERYTEGAEMDLARPAIPTLGFDDRPWLAAHGNGYVYYMANSIVGPNGRQQVLRSTDAGATFEQEGFFISDSGEGSIAADPNSSYVYVATNHLFKPQSGLDGGPPTAIQVSVSPDRGSTWTNTRAADYTIDQEPEPVLSGFSPIPAVSPVDGSIHIVWTDGPERLMITSSFDKGTTWKTQVASPFPGRFGMPWIDVAPDGTIGVSFVADPTDDGMKHTSVYAMLLDPMKEAGRKRCPKNLIALGRVPNSSNEDPLFQRDFFQLAFGPDKAIHVVFRPAEIDGALAPDFPQVAHTRARTR